VVQWNDFKGLLRERHRRSGCKQHGETRSD